MVLLFQACRAAAFSGIDFEDTFVWGVDSKTTMDVPACVTPTACVATDVDAAATSVTCSSVKE